MSSRGAFTNDDDKQVVLEMSTECQFCLYSSKGFSSQMSTRGRQVVKKGQNFVNVVKECPISTASDNKVQTVEQSFVPKNFCETTEENSKLKKRKKNYKATAWSPVKV